MKKLLIFVAAIGMFSAAHAQYVAKTPLVATAQGAHCNSGFGPVPLMAYDPDGHPMRCAHTDKNGSGSWQYVAESDVDRVTRKLAQLNSTDTQILARLTELLAVQRANVQK